MEKFVTNIEELPQQRKEAILNGLKSQIIAKAMLIRENQPTEFLAYVDEQIGKANASMLEMVEVSSRDGVYLERISEIYIWNKERRMALERLKEEFLNGQQQPQNHAQEPQRGDLHYYCQKAVEKGYLNKVGYRSYRRVTWSKAQLAYFLSRFLEDGKFPDKKYNLMFGETRLAKAADQLINNIKTDGKPRGYEAVDEILLT